MAYLNYKFPLGYTVTQKVSVMDIYDAVEILSTRKRRRYVCAHRNGFETVVELRRNVWKCPFCNFECPTAFMDNQEHKFIKRGYYDRYINKNIIRTWGTCQLSFLENTFEDLTLAPETVISGEWLCPKCQRRSEASTGERNVCIEYGSDKVQIKAEICSLNEFLSIPWITDGEITIRFPIYEVLNFNIQSGHTCIDLRGSDETVIATRDITTQPYVWEKGVIYRLLRDNVVVRRTVKRLFADLFGGMMPFSKDELLPDKYILMTRFIGFPREFYDAIPYLKGTFQIEETFKSVADKLHKAEDALVLLKNADVPKCKSIKKIFLTNIGLLFYINECEKLWRAVNDVNHYRYLLKKENIFEVLSLLHQRPLLFDLVYDYTAVNGAKAMIEMLTQNWVTSIEYAIDYCTMNYALKAVEREKWKTRDFKHQAREEYDDDEDLDDENIDNGMYLRRYNKYSTFSVPMKKVNDSIPNCIVDDFHFCWLRSGNDYYMAGKALSNCLTEWSSFNNPVVAVKKDEKIVAAIEVGASGVHQVRGHGNLGILRVPGLPEAYCKWLDKYKLKEVLHYTHNELPF